MDEQQKVLENEVMTENYCDECDEVLNAVFDRDAFYSFKVGRIRCPCGCVVKPCNECLNENDEHYDCDSCPWENAEISNAMSIDAYLRWMKVNEPKNYDVMKEHYKTIYNEEIENIEKDFDGYGKSVNEKEC